MKSNLKTLLESANALVESYDSAEAKSKVGHEQFIFIDVREKEELETEGKVPGALHIPRGMLEFTLDPNSPYYNNIFEVNKTFIFYCKSGGRSVLAAQRAVEMGLKNVRNLEGGFLGWNKN